MRWLLLLGAESRYGHTLDDALNELRALGPLQRLTPIVETPAADGGSRRYRNLLVCIDAPGPRSALVAVLKCIERGQGRGTLDGVPLDIDVLACDAGDGWLADPHALGKHEFDAAHVRRLLHDAGLDGVPGPVAGTLGPTRASSGT